MAMLTKLILLGPPILLLLLTALAGAVYSRIDSLSLPIPKPLALLTVILPIISYASTYEASVLVRQTSQTSKRKGPQLNLRLLLTIGLQLMYETAIATLATTHIIPPSGLLCGLNEKWAKLWKDKNADAIKAIQDSLNCCGFNSVKDRAWPFNSNQPSECGDLFKRTRSCVGVWRQAEQVSAGLLLLVAVLVFVVKILSVISLFTNPRGVRPRWAVAEVGDEPAVEDNRAEVRRLTEEGESASAFQDDPEDAQSRFIEAPNDQSPRIESSQLAEHRNAWRDS